MRTRILVLTAVLLASCSDDERTERSPGEQPADRRLASPAPPPDAGTQAGHGADAGLVTVPVRDPSPPTASITLAAADGGALAETSQPLEGKAPRSVTLDEPRLRGTTTGRDADGGVARVRVSIREEIECRGGDGTYRRLRTRYFPPPQVERIRSNPGALLPTSAKSSLPLSLSKARCGAGRVTAVHGELWGEAINGGGLEAVTPHLRFVYEAD